MKSTLRSLAVLSVSLFVCGPLAALQEPGVGPVGGTPVNEIPWSRRSAEHLLNRAGFGATAAEVDAAFALGPERVVEQLLDGGREVEPPFFGTIGVGTFGGMRGMSEAEKRELRRKVRRADREQVAGYIGWWIERMVAGEDPLRDRMTLFWHGLFTTNSRELRRTFEVIQQHQLLRNNALESYAAILSGIVEDPAMLYYLDNTQNKKGKPNENLARELMELFSLGEGHYSEQDVKEVARALTGNGAGRDGAFKFNRKQHDRGQKTILGQSGRFDAQDVVRILLEQDACARWISGRLIEYFEGVWPEIGRHEEYAGLLKSNDYQLRPFLRKLLLDPAFYRDEVVGTRVMGPVDYLVSSERRLGLELPPRFIYSASKELGQTLFQPPSVKGWEGGEAWITTASLIGRGNAAGMMLGVLDSEVLRGELLADARGGEDMQGEALELTEENSELEPEMDMGDSMSGEMDDYAAENGGTRRLPSALRTLGKALGANYRPKLNLSWRLRHAEVTGDGPIVEVLLDELLAIEAPRSTRDALVRQLAGERAALGLDEDEFLERPLLCEPVLRRLSHLILSLPEAQLH